MALACLAPLSSSVAQNFVDIKPSPAQVEWQDLEIGVIFHFGTNTFLNREWGDGTASPSVFHPTHVDTDQWMEAAKAGGARYAVLVAKHHDGFALWPSKQTDYSVKNSPWLDGKGDLVRMASDSAHKAGLGFGVYLSPWDRHDKRYPDPKAYDKYYLAQLDELATHYGSLAFDIARLANENPELGERVHPDAPEIWAQVVYARDHEWAETPDDVLRRRTTLTIRGLATDDVRAGVQDLLDKK